VGAARPSSDSFLLRCSVHRHATPASLPVGHVLPAATVVAIHA
jgi:hypothetical protein